MNRALVVSLGLLGWLAACGSDDASSPSPSLADASVGSEAGAASDGGDAGAAAPGDAGDAGDAGIDPDAPIPRTFTGTTYYVSPTGNDTNTGLSPSAAWQSVAKVQASTFGPGDAVLFEGSQSFAGCLAFTPNRVQSTRTAPFTVGRYGTGNFTLTADATCTQSAVQIAGINGFVLQDATVRGNGIAAYGVWLFNATAAPTGGVTVRCAGVAAEIEHETSCTT